MFLGIDFGTSGCRACIINQHEEIVFEAKVPIAIPKSKSNQHQQNPKLWWQALLSLFKTIKENFQIEDITDICINGTSATVVYCDSSGHAITDALMYNDASSIDYIADIKAVAPANHVTLSANSALSKMMMLYHQHKCNVAYMLNQADWVSNILCQQFPYSDYNNALKMGFDPVKNEWPSWVTQLIPKTLLPEVLEPGTCIGTLTESIADEFGFNSNVNIKLGTTDSIAAFIATGIKTNHQAVTSLGSTIVLKQLAETQIEDSQHGIYSHKLGRYWLVGGASNAGGKVLLKYFTSEQIKQLSTEIDVKIPSGLNYYPLTNTGERFPINDPLKQPEISPRPQEDFKFLHALFEGLANIEALGYKMLNQLGAQYPKEIITCGGGAQNKTWQQIRQQLSNTQIQPATHSEACYGSALLAKNGISYYL